MIRLLSTLIICAFICLPAMAQDKKGKAGYNQCMDTAVSTVDMNACYQTRVESYLKKINDKLALIYQSEKISEAYKTKTREAQESWLQYARSQSGLVCASIKPADCGTISSLKAGQRFIDQLDLRNKEVDRQIKELKKLLTVHQASHS